MGRNNNGTASSDTTPGEPTQAEKTARRVIERYLALQKRLKLLAAIFWLAAIFGWALALLARAYNRYEALADVALSIAFILAIVTTVRLYLTTRKADMEQIKAALASIEELLKKGLEEK